jgi:hypothetical protein
MATIFLSYRRTDSPEACRVYDWLGQRFGYDSIFMDVAAIPFAVRFPDFIKQAIAKSGVLIALIGAEWARRIRDANDPVRMEIEAAIAHQIPMLPVLIGNTPMPDVEELPTSISAIASQNAVTVGVSLDFHSHMQVLLPKIESILGALAATSIGHSDSHLIQRACNGIRGYLEEAYMSDPDPERFYCEWKVISADSFGGPPPGGDTTTLYVHRVGRLAELIELHFILSFWARNPAMEQLLAGWVMFHLEQSPVVPDEFFGHGVMGHKCTLRIRWSDEDPRRVWKMITDMPLRLSLAYVATVSPKGMSARVPIVRAVEDAAAHLISDALPGNSTP